MKLSTKTRYAVRSMICIGCYGKDKPVSIAEINSKEDISERYLELIFARLKQTGLIYSSRGNRGGYRLAKKPEDISIYDIFSVMEKSTSIIKEHGANNDMKEMLRKEIWGPIDENLRVYLSNIKLADLIK